MSELPSHPPSPFTGAIQPGLTLVATPIGHAADLSLRAIAVLRSADLVLCEDTRTSAALFAVHKISSKMEALHDHNEEARLPALIMRLRAGAAVALISDAGTPLVSDPGFRLVRAAIEAGVKLHAVPGANAALTALLLSGLPPHPFLFMGFAPPKTAARRASYAALRAAEQAGLSATLIWYEAPHRVAETLADLHAIFGARPVAVGRELTKKFEEVRRGSLTDLAAHYATAEARGEFTLVVGPAPKAAETDGDVTIALQAALQHMSLKDAAAYVAEATGRSRKEVYRLALAIDR